MTSTTAAVGGNHTALQAYIVERRRQRPLLLMTHLVIGYPSLESSWQLALGMVEAGVDLLELQIPFSEPMADGPVILEANQKALAAGVRVQDCFDFARRLRERVDVPLLFMSYCNVPMRRGFDRFASDAVAAGVSGAIIPDLPVEESAEYFGAARAHGLDPILLIAPNTPQERIAEIDARGAGMLYLVARKGVTGAETRFSDELDTYLSRVREVTRLPLALGFGLKARRDIEFVRGKVDVAVVGSASLSALDRGGVEAAISFVETLVCR